jgi:chemotaxis protein MotB
MIGPWVLALGFAGVFSQKDCPRRATVEQLDREVMACQIRLDEAKETARNCADASAPMALYRELLQAYSGTEVVLRRDGARVVVSIPSSLLFPADGVEIRREARLVVDLLATAMNLHPEMNAWVVAHTDDAPLPRSLQRAHGDALGLTQAQAGTLVRVLTGEFKVDAGRLAAAGLGNARPMVPTETDGARAKNRRVDVVIGLAEDWR